MMVGYNHGSGADEYRMWHPGTNRLHWTKDTIWLKKVYHETTNQGAKIIYSKPIVRNIEAEEAIRDKIVTEQEEKETSDVSDREGDNPRDNEKSTYLRCVHGQKGYLPNQ